MRSSSRKYEELAKKDVEIQVMLDDKKALELSFEEEKNLKALVMKHFSRVDAEFEQFKLKFSDEALEAIKKKAVEEFQGSETFRDLVEGKAYPYLDQGIKHLFRVFLAQKFIDLTPRQLVECGVMESWSEELRALHSKVLFDVGKISDIQKAYLGWVPPPPGLENVCAVMLVLQEATYEGDLARQ